MKCGDKKIQRFKFYTWADIHSLVKLLFKIETLYAKWSLSKTCDYGLVNEGELYETRKYSIINLN